MVENTPLIKDRYLHLPDGPGLGLELDDGFIAEYNAEDKL
jgi:L-alanine-DL-glutamate epimerase-like enolase superfamily enzyme